MWNVDCLYVTVGIGTLLAVTILSIQQLGTQAVAKALEWLFMTLLPNFCFGQSVLDLYSNFMFLNACQPYLVFCQFVCPANGTMPCCKGEINSIF